MCREENMVPHDQKKIYGISDNCSICLVNKVEIFLPNCGHACLCIECVQEIDENKLNMDIIEEKDFPFNFDSTILEEKKYIVVGGGLGCSWYVRKNSHNKVQALFMHADNWGQYGAAHDHRPILNQFIRGYTEHT